MIWRNLLLPLYEDKSYFSLFYHEDGSSRFLFNIRAHVTSNRTVVLVGVRATWIALSQNVLVKVR
jgi:hypothetical protein